MQNWALIVVTYARRTLLAAHQSKAYMAGKAYGWHLLGHQRTFEICDAAWGTHTCTLHAGKYRSTFSRVTLQALGRKRRRSRHGVA